MCVNVLLLLDWAAVSAGLHALLSIYFTVLTALLYCLCSNKMCKLICLYMLHQLDRLKLVIEGV